MDPNQTFLDMLKAMKNQEFEAARERALALKEWLAKGGFTPLRFTADTINGYIASILRRTALHGPEPVFSLVCQQCDAGMDIESEEQAIEEGWSGIEPAFDLPQANYCGLCPDCRQEQED